MLSDANIWIKVMRYGIAFFITGKEVLSLRSSKEEVDPNILLKCSTYLNVNDKNNVIERERERE